ncbi:DUF397 domain-containing protein [Streptomyces sp. cg36]|uniref:DUF397 domain-containing protein n=1 Tax=Streptomyces sp. cg36 TaxID=3238798 RepID=UPI0034E2B0AB
MIRDIPPKKSSRSGAGGEQCIYVERKDGVIKLNESALPGVEILTSMENFAAFLAGAKAGEFDEYVN